VSLEGSVGKVLYPENMYNSSYIIIYLFYVLKPILYKMENKKTETVRLFYKNKKKVDERLYFGKTGDEEIVREIFYMIYMCI
jgi:hypothetical protein